MASTRRLAAIFAADVAGYSRLMGADEEGTHERLRAHLRELVEPKIKEHRGRTVMAPSTPNARNSSLLTRHAGVEAHQADHGGGALVAERSRSRRARGPDDQGLSHPALAPVLVRPSSDVPASRNRWFADSSLEGSGFEPPVPQRRSRICRLSDLRSLGPPSSYVGVWHRGAFRRQGREPRAQICSRYRLLRYPPLPTLPFKFSVYFSTRCQTPSQSAGSG